MFENKNKNIASETLHLFPR